MKLLYIHVPKCAGSSIISMYKGRKLKAWGHNLRLDNFTPFPQSRLAKVKKMFPKFFNRFYTSFTVIRNPWSRTYSAYIYLSNGGNCNEDREDFEKYIKPYSDFEDFVLNGLDKASKEQLHFIPQLYWICDDNGEVLVDNVIKLKDINDSLPDIISQAGLTPKKLPRINTSGAPAYKAAYSKASKTKIAEIYSDTIEAFNFDF